MLLGYLPNGLEQHLGNWLERFYGTEIDISSKTSSEAEQVILDSTVYVGTEVRDSRQYSRVMKCAEKGASTSSRSDSEADLLIAISTLIGFPIQGPDFEVSKHLRSSRGDIRGGACRVVCGFAMLKRDTSGIVSACYPWITSFQEGLTVRELLAFQSHESPYRLLSQNEAKDEIVNLAAVMATGVVRRFSR